MGLGVPPSPAHTGTQTLRYGFNNRYPPYYAEAARTLDPTQDWTEAGVKTLTLFFYGRPANPTTETMFCRIEDSSSNLSARVNYGDQLGEDMSDVQLEEWQEWNIPLSSFSGVDLTSVSKLRIGFGPENPTPNSEDIIGLVYFDDIRLYPPKCVPAYGPPYDFSGNCVVDMADVAIMAEQWLRTDACLPVQAPPTGPVGWWKLDGSAVDSSGNGNHGTPEGNYSWVAGKIGGAIEFSGDGGRVLIPPDSSLDLTTEVTLAAWINISQMPPDGARIIVKGWDDDDRESYCIELGDEERIGFFVRDPNGENYAVDSQDEMPRNEWIHVAGTYDGNAVRCYINGQLDNEDTVGSFSLLVDANLAAAIGNRVDANDRAFIGKIDDARIYNYALSDENIAYIATQGTGYVPLDAVSNVYDAEPAGQKAVNFKDFAELLTAWLEEKLWPAE